MCEQAEYLSWSSERVRAFILHKEASSGKKLRWLNDNKQFFVLSINVAPCVGFWNTRMCVLNITYTRTWCSYNTDWWSNATCVHQVLGPRAAADIIGIHSGARRISPWEWRNIKSPNRSSGTRNATCKSGMLTHRSGRGNTETDTK